MNILRRIRNKVIRTFVESFLRRRGVKNNYIRQVTTESLIKDWKNCKRPIKEKIWAVKRGFYPNRMDLWGLNESNYTRYLSDINYLALFPLNNRFQIWLDDKITTRYVLQDTRYKDFMPRYYIYIEKDGTFSYMMDFNEQISKDADSLLNLLKQEKILAMKPLAGSLGKGFIRLELKGNDIYANNKLLTLEEFAAMKSTLKSYIVTEYCRQHSQFNRVWPDSECTLRIVLGKIKDKYGGGKTKAILSYARFGSSLSSTTSNMSQGGLGVTFDFETGVLSDVFYRKKQFEKSGNTKLDVHPDTHVRIAGEKLPNWDIVKKGLYGIVDYFSTLEYFGFDVIITDDGFKICEINSLPGLDIEQVMFGPIMDNEAARSYFTYKMQQS